MDNSTLNITGGMDVVGSDDEKVGEVADVQGDYVIVSKGFFFPKDYYIPTSAITSADDKKVYLNVTKEQALDQGWDTVPETTTTTTGYAETPAPTGGAYPDKGGDAPFEHEADTGHFEESDKIDVALTDEELTARKTAVERGAVKVDKVVTEEEQSIDVPVTEERVNVSRRTVDRDVMAGDDSFEEGTIEVPLYGEDVEVEKRARVTEEVEISKDQVQDTERVSGTVRSADVRVTDETGAEMRDGDSSGGKKKKPKK